MEDTYGLWREEAFSALLTLTDWGVLVIDSRRRIITINQRACDLLGVAPSQMQERDTTEFFPDSQLVRVLSSGKPEYWRPAVRNGRPLLVCRLPLSRRGQALGAMAVFREDTGATTATALPLEPGLPASLTQLAAQSSAMAQLARLATAYAASPAPLLLTGEEGTGRSLLALLIHRQSRPAGPFLTVSCAALAGQEPESVLFGAKGLLAQARGGTLYFKNLEGLPLSFQTRLALFLDGSPGADVRLLFSSGEHPDHLSPALLYRLAVLRLRLPPLRERTEDLPGLAHAYALRRGFPLFAQNAALIQKVLEMLKNYPFPGNIRELNNLLERLNLLLAAGQTDPGTLAGLLTGGEPAASPAAGVRDTLESRERQTIVELLLKHQGNKTLVAQELGISPTTLWRRMRDYHIQ